MNKALKIFISSTYEDLAKEREAIQRKLFRLKNTIPIDMKYFGSRPDNPVETCIKELSESDVYIGIFAHRYGSIVLNNNISWTELEYNKAKELKKPILIYLTEISEENTISKFVENDDNLFKKLIEFKNRLKKEETISFFNTPEELAGNVIADLFNLFLHQIGVLDQILSDELLQNYLLSVISHHRRLKPLAIEREIEMDSIYIRLQLSPKYLSTNLENIANKKQKTIEQLIVYRELNIHEALENYKQIIIIGDPGCGKTTTLRHAAYFYARQNIEKLENEEELNNIPIYIPLAIYGSSSKTVFDYINDIIKNYNLPVFFSKLLNNYFEKGKVLLLIDGIDEIREDERNQVITSLEGLMHSYNHCSIILSSREIGYQHRLPGIVLQVLPMTNDLIKGFINSWFKVINEVNIGIDLLNSILKSQRLLSLAKNPFLLSILCLIVENGKKLPERRTELYELCTNTLLVFWDEEKGIRRNKFNYTIKQFILIELSLYFFEKGEKNLLTFRSVHSVTDDLLNKKNFKISSEEVIKEIHQNSGLLRLVVPSQQYEFAHRTLQEYFVACSLLPENRDSNTMYEYLNKYYSNSQWTEIFRLLTGILKDATPFLESVFDKDPTLGARCYLDADPIAVDHNLIRQRWNQIKEEELVNIINDIPNKIKDESEIYDFFHFVFQTGENRNEVLYNCDKILNGIGTKDAIKLSQKMFNWWPKERQFINHKKTFAEDPFWKFAKIPNGLFLMGSGRYDHPDEKPTHRVELSQFQLLCYPVSIKQYSLFDPKHVDKFSSKFQSFFKNENQPIIMISWFDAYIFCKWIGCQLPSEAQWEYACSCYGEYHWSLGNHFNEKEYCFNKDCTCIVGSYPANKLGLYDMTGNVWEWCSDWYYGSYDWGKWEIFNPKGPTNGNLKVLRGGAWNNHVQSELRVTRRLSGDPRAKDISWGFRCAKSLVK